jgi:predicted nucleic acid-binding protein
MAERLELENALARFDRLLLDTCVLIAEFNRPTGRLRAINRPQRATSKVSLWEFLHGAEGALLSAARRRARRAWLREQDIDELRLSAGASKSFESLLQTAGPPSVADALLAAESLAQTFPIVTSNVKDFEDVAGLRYVAW